MEGVCKFEVAKATLELSRDDGIKVSCTLVEEGLEAHPEVLKTPREGVAVGGRDGVKEGGEGRTGTGGAKAALAPGDKVVSVVNSAGGVGRRGGGGEAEVAGVEGGAGGNVSRHSSMNRTREEANVHEIKGVTGGARVGKGGGYSGDKAGNMCLRSEAGGGIGASGGGGSKDIMGPRSGARAETSSRNKSRGDVGR